MMNRKKYGTCSRGHRTDGFDVSNSELSMRLYDQELDENIES